MGAFHIYTDGSCYYKSRLGGIGGILRYQFFKKPDGSMVPIEQTFSIPQRDTTVPRCELLAIITAMGMIKKSFKGRIFLNCDAENTVLNIQDPERLRRKNLDLWTQWNQIDAHFGDQISIKWIPREDNKVADKLAGAAYQEAKKLWDKKEDK